MMQCTLLVDEVGRLMWDVSRETIKYTPLLANGHGLATRALHYRVVERDTAPSCALEVRDRNYLLR